MSVSNTQVMEMAKGKDIAQINIELDPEFKNELKAFAALTGRSMKFMLTKYIREGLEKEKREIEESKTESE